MNWLGSLGKGSEERLWEEWWEDLWSDLWSDRCRVSRLSREAGRFSWFIFWYRIYYYENGFLLDLKFWTKDLISASEILVSSPKKQNY
jgi:hypothetical protein